MTTVFRTSCFFDDPDTMFDIGIIDVVAGEYNTAQKDSGEQRRSIVSRTLYPGYKLYPGYEDVGVLKLSSPLVFSKSVRPLRIARKGEIPKGTAEYSIQYRI